MNLVVDVGNSSAKVALFQSEKLMKQKTFLKLNLDEIIEFTNSTPPSRTIISSVQKKDKNLDSIINHFNALHLSHKTTIPISVVYKTPETLGTDRIAAIVGANDEFPKKNLLSIDAGSCITYDYFLERNYIGGRISPGLKMRFDALSQFTSQLPKLHVSDLHFQLGSDTNSSIISGVQQGAIDEMDAIISNFREENKDTVVILSGGYCDFFEKHLKNSIFADPFIVLKGLNIILEYNAK